MRCRRLLTAAFGIVVVPGAVVALPVVTPPSPSPHPVAPTTYHLAVPHQSSSGQLHAATTTLPASPQYDTHDFRAVGLSWVHDPKLTSLRAEIRVRSGGKWSDWQQVESADNGADGNRDAGAAPSRDGTDPLWVDHANGVQVQVESVQGDAPSDLRLDLIDPGTSTADTSLAGPSTLSRAAVARADTSEPTIITRAEWGADESLRLNACPNGPESAGAIKVAFVHHTVTGNDYTADDVPAIVRSIYAYHVQSEGWCDIGYNFLVDKFGRIFEGRYGGVDKAILGAHTGGFNANSFGVSMIGTFTSATPPTAMTDAMVHLIAWKFGTWYLNPEGHETLTAAPFSQSRYTAGTNVSFASISGHRDADLTSCPGDGGYSVLPFIREAVFNTMQAGIVDPTVSVTPRSLSANGSVHITAGMLHSGSWQLGIAGPTGTTVRTLSGSGSSVDVTWDMTDDSGQPVPAGNYAVTLISAQNGVAARSWTTTLTVGAPFGSLDSAAAPSYGTVQASGWAVHGTNDSPDQVRITVSSRTVATVTADQSRPDVASGHPGYSADHGFSATVSASPGFHTICAYGVDDIAGGPDTLLGCRGVTVPGAPPQLTGPAANPVGHLDVVEAGPTLVRVVGWTLDPETASPISFAVYVDDHFMGVYRAALPRPDVAAAHPNYGDDHGFDQLVGGVVPGTHRVCVYALNIGNGTTNPTLGCTSATVPTGNPNGHLDVVASVPGGLVTWGWATDPDTLGAVPVHLYVDGRLTTVVSANQQRADVAAAFPLYGAAHGFAASMPLPAGQHTLCAYALNVGAGSANVKLGCGSVSVLAGNPIGHVDALTAIPGGAITWGWAIDPDTAGTDSVSISVDGAQVMTLQANQSRPDVGEAYPAYGAAHGFATTLPVPNGRHTVCVDAVNVKAGTSNTRLHCSTLTVLAGNPIGHLDHAAVTNGTLALWGWAIDPDTTAPDAVHVYVDGKFVTVLTANEARPDVAQAYPAYGDRHGYSFAEKIGAGKHTVCTYGINVKAGTTNTTLGCVVVGS